MIFYEHTLPTLLIWLSLLAAVALGGLSAWRHAPRTGGMALIGAAYLLFLALLAWCLFLPGRRTDETHTLKPRFVVAVDTSQSMKLSPSAEISNRWSVVQQTLAMPWAQSVAAECEIDVYTFDADVSRQPSLADLQALEPQGKATLLREALQKITGRYAGVNVVGGLVLTDGNDTREGFDEWAEAPRPFPLYTLRLEPEAAWSVEPDLRIDAVNTPRRVTVNWQTELKAVVSGQGSAGRAVNVQLFRDLALLQESPTQVPEDGGSRQLVFPLTHPEIGVFTFRVFAPPLPGERNTNDNEYAVSVQVIDAKNRLIYVEGPPRWESKYLKRALQANQQVTPLIFVQGPGGKPIGMGPVGSMTADLTDSQLAFFKIVVLGNLDGAELGERRAASLIKFVETGGSLVLLGGSKAWGAKGLAATPLKKILPADGFTPKPQEGEFPVGLTDAGRTHPAFAGDPQLWGVIPPVLSFFPGGVLAPGAVGLVEAQTPGGPQPIIVSQRYGDGKVVAVLTDTLWKWTLHPDAIENRPYQRFWDQLIAWLLPAEDELEKDRLEIFADKESLSLGESLKISARLGGGSSSRSGAVRCDIVRPDGTRAPFAMRPETVTTATGKAYPGFATSYEAQQPGLHMVTATLTAGDKPLTSESLSFLVKPYSPESIPRPVNSGVLKNISLASRGRHFTDREALNDALAALTFRSLEQETSEYHSLWQRPGVIACLMALASLAWIVRKMGSMP